MLRVNILVGSADLNWIAGRFARELCLRLPRYGVHAEMNEPSMKDLTYYQIVYGVPDACDHPTVGLFTHGDFRPRNFGPAYTGQICLNTEMLRYLQETVGTESPRMIEQPVDEKFIKPTITFGVAGRTYSDGRKGEHLVKAAVEAGYIVIGWGSGWPCPIVSDRVEDLPHFYRSIDYYIDTSSDEGGCTPALECLAMGKPVISHTLGVDRPVLAYQTHDWDSLHRVMHKLTHPRTYDDWASDHADYFRQTVQRGLHG